MIRTNLIYIPLIKTALVKLLEAIANDLAKKASPRPLVGGLQKLFFLVLKYSYNQVKGEGLHP